MAIPFFAPAARQRTMTAGVLAAVFLAVGTQLVVAASALADDEPVTFGIRPAGEPERSFELTLDPGAVHEDAAEILNLGDEPIDVRVYAVDAVTTEEGGFGLQPAGEAPVDAGAWVRFEGGAESVTITVPADSGAIVPFEVVVPENATPGDHPGAVVAAIEGETGGAIQVQHRTGTRLLLHVSGELHPTLELRQVSSTYVAAINPGDGSVITRFTLFNSGNVALRASPQIVTVGLFGAWSTTTPVEQTDLILPGASLRISVRTDGIPALVALTSDVTIETAVDVDGPAISPLPEPRATAVALAIPWSVLVVAVLFYYAILGVRLLRLRARERFEARVEERVQRELATQHEVGQTSGLAAPPKSHGVETAPTVDA